MSLKLLAKETCKNERVTVLRHFYTVSFKLSVKNKTGKSQRLRDKTYKVVSLISMCTSIISMDISMDLSMDIHIHGKPVHFTSTNCVYVAVHAQGRTTSYDVVRSVNAALYAASKAIILEHNGVCRVENLYELNTILHTIIAHRRNLLQARATPLSRNGVRDVIDHVTI